MNGLYDKNLKINKLNFKRKIDLFFTSKIIIPSYGLDFSLYINTKNIPVPVNFEFKKTIYSVSISSMN